jgi:hypothetical protein
MPIIIKRASDNQTFTVADANEQTRVGDLKNKLKAQFPPKFAHGCRLLFHSKVLKSIHQLKHYGVEDNGTIEMDDRKDWKSSSSSSDSDRD